MPSISPIGFDSQDHKVPKAGAAVEVPSIVNEFKVSTPQGPINSTTSSGSWIELG